MQAICSPHNNYDNHIVAYSLEEIRQVIQLIHTNLFNVCNIRKITPVTFNYFRMNTY